MLEEIWSWDKPNVIPQIPCFIIEKTKNNTHGIFIHNTGCFYCCCIRCRHSPIKTTFDLQIQGLQRSFFLYNKINTLVIRNRFVASHTTFSIQGNKFSNTSFSNISFLLCTDFTDNHITFVIHFIVWVDVIRIGRCPHKTRLRSVFIDIYDKLSGHRSLRSGSLRNQSFLQRNFC